MKTMSCTWIRYGCLLGALILGLSQCTAKKPEPLGSEANPVRFYFTPSVDSKTVASGSQVLVKFLEKETGYHIRTGIPVSYIAVVEAFGSERAHVAVMATFGYLMANKRYGARAELLSIRNGHKYYRGQIITRTNSGIKNVSDLKGKSFAYTDAASTSGYLLPRHLIEKNAVKLGRTMFAMKHDNVVTMVYQGRVDAGATYYSPPSADGKIQDARTRVKTQFPDVEAKVKVIALTDQIPNDPFVVGKTVPVEVANKLIAAMHKFIATDEGKSIFKKLYGIDGFADANDSDFEPLRITLASLGVDAAKLVKN